MRKLNLETRRPPGLTLEDWLGKQFEQLNEASREDTADAAAEAFVFDDTSVTETVTFDPATANAATVRNVLSTLLMYLRRGAPNKTQ